MIIAETIVFCFFKLSKINEQKIKYVKLLHILEDYYGIVFTETDLEDLSFCTINGLVHLDNQKLRVT